MKAHDAGLEENLWHHHLLRAQVYLRKCIKGQFHETYWTQVSYRIEYSQVPDTEAKRVSIFFKQLVSYSKIISCSKNYLPTLSAHRNYAQNVKLKKAYRT